MHDFPTRREVLKGLTIAAAIPAISLAELATAAAPKGQLRCINVVNFIRGVEPRFKTDLLEPVQRQMEIINQRNLPATWLLQYDALVSGDFVRYLKENMAPSHEVGFWFEMNQMHCNAAGVEWRGRPGYEWDHLPPVAFTIGYSPDERVKLADTAMAKFKDIWGHYPKSVASWNLDSLTIAHLVDKYHVDAFAVCRDQIATDGFTIWGAPIAGYYPSKSNCWSPATTERHQIHAPVFRMLGQDPIHYYSVGYKYKDGRTIHEPDTMEPVWTSGRDDRFIAAFLKMIGETEAMDFAYAQLGQENSFPWRDQEPAYAKQMDALVALRDSGKVHVETMGQSGRRFKKAFTSTPLQAQIMLEDPYGVDPKEKTIWYQSKHYRANLHIEDGVPFLRDITLYKDLNPQPFLTKATRQNDVEQRMPAVLDGFHWRKKGEKHAAGYFTVGSEKMKIIGQPVVTRKKDVLTIGIELEDDQTLLVSFTEQTIEAYLISKANGQFKIEFEWDPKSSALVEVESNHVKFKWQDQDYSVQMKVGHATQKDDGWTASSTNNFCALKLA